MIIHRKELDEDMSDLSDCIFPIDHMPTTPEAKEIIDEYERKNPVILKIRYIPHLRLKLPPFDLDRALKEVHQYYESNDFMGLDLNGLSLDEGGRVSKYKGIHSAWSSRALVNFTPNSKGTWGKDDREIAMRDFPDLQPNADKIKNRRPFLQDMKFYKTDLWDSLPYITSYITENLCGDMENIRRSFLYKLKAGGRIKFHNHRFLPFDNTAAPHEEGIIHIPLITHPSSMMYQLIGDSDWIDARHYEPGEVWLFNTYANHAVDNKKSPIDRLHLVVMVDFSDKKFTELIEKSI